MNTVFLIFVFILSLMFLAMIFGEQLSLFGVVDGRWIMAPFDLVSKFWELICEATDRLWCFVFDHFWWVTATVTGSVGILLIALLMVGGLSNEARAVRIDSKKIVNAGGVLDVVPVIDTQNVLQTKLVDSEDRVSQLMHQKWSDNRFWVPPVVKRPIVKQTPKPQPRPRISDVPPLEINSPLSDRRLDYSRDQLDITMEPYIERIGHPVRSQVMDRMILQTMMELQDDWRNFSNTGSMARRGSSRPPLREDTNYALERLYSQVQIIPEDYVAANSLQVEKSAPANTGPGEFEIQIRVRNMGLEKISGVIVRELLPVAWTPVETEPRGVYRESTITWLLDTLEPREAIDLTLAVASTETGPFESFTEVSASSAVTSAARIEPESRELPPVERRVPPIEPEEPLPLPERRNPIDRGVLPERRERIEYPELRLTFDPRPTQATVGEWVDVKFTIENIGRVPAEGVTLFVDLPLELDHKYLDPTDFDRQVESRVARLNAGEKRERTLRVRPDRDGRHISTASLALQGRRLATEDFEINARQVRDNSAPLLPRPDNIGQ